MLEVTERDQRAMPQTYSCLPKAMLHSSLMNEESCTSSGASEEEEEEEEEDAEGRENEKEERTVGSIRVGG
ncbi:hypothetical protein FACS189472_13870 [Alphaproteobacteria bacterium]|nr:hypothetical protein FACS189472_13870 [Alphaproteobacteria bacterium]